MCVLVFLFSITVVIAVVIKDKFFMSSEDYRKTESEKRMVLSLQDDVLDRYIFENHDVRVCFVYLNKSIVENLRSQDYPPAVQKLLGEFITACALLAASLKFEGRLVLQLRANAAVSLLMAECTDEGHVRAYAQVNTEMDEQDLTLALEQFEFSDFRKGTLALTIEPKTGESYQGIVPLEGKNLAQCLQNYFLQSEQLESHFYLLCEGQYARGFMLQQLPAQLEKNSEVRLLPWEEVIILADTLTPQELLSLPSDKLMYRLFHEHQVRFLGQQSLQFKCSCSRQRMDNALASLGAAELQSILLEQGQIDVRCEFCKHGYIYAAQEVEALFLKDKQQLFH